MILQDEGTHYLQHQGDGDYFVRGGPGVPENFLATADFDGWRRGFSDADDPNPGNDNPNNIARHQFAAHEDDFAGSNSDLWATDSENLTDGQNILGAVDYLADQGQNTIYLLTNTIGGDGKDVGPWVGNDIYGVGTNKNSISASGLSNDDFSTYDVSKLEQWERLFDYMDERGIYKNVLFQETENEKLLNGGTNVSGSSLSVERMVYMREMIARFGHNNGIQWNLGEENSDQTNQERADMAAWTKAVDPYDHLVVIHTFGGEHDEIYGPLLDDPAFDGPSFQTNAGSIRSKTIEWREESADAGDPWVIAWDEDSGSNADVSANNTDPGETRALREGFWGHLTAGGSGGNWYLKGNGFGGHSFDQNLDDFSMFEVIWEWTEAATSFFNTYIPFWEMELDDSATTNSGDYVLSKDGEYYVVYLKYGQADDVALDLSDHGGESFDVFWYDPRNGGPLIDAGTVQGGAVVEFGNPPNAVGADWVLFARNSALPDTPPSVPPSDVPEPPDPTPTPGDLEITLTLIEPGDDTEEGTLENGATVDLDDFAAGISVSAEPSETGVVGSAVFRLDGSTVQTENVAPYALFGDTGGDFEAGNIAPGAHTLTVDMFSGQNGSGSLLGSETVSFTVEAADGGGSGGGGGGSGGGGGGGGGEPAPPPGEGYYEGIGSGNNYRFKIQIEDAGPNPGGDWQYLTAPDGDGHQAGFQGSGYYLYGDEQSISNNSSPKANELLEYRIYIPEDQLGVYDFRAAVSRDPGGPGDRRNDLWLGIELEGSNSLEIEDLITASAEPEPKSGGAIKVFGAGTSNWGFANNYDGANNNPDLKLEITEAGFYTVQIWGRSQGYHVDYFELIKGSNPSNNAADSPFVTEGDPEPIDPPAPNLPPVAQEDSASVTAGEAVTIDVLANDSDPENVALSIELVGTGSIGTASVVDGEVRYVADGGDGGTDTLTYRAVDAAGNESALTEVTVSVAPEPADAPPPDPVDPPNPGPADPLFDIFLADTDSDASLGALTDGVTIVVEDLGEIPLTIYAETTDAGDAAGVTSVKLEAPGIDDQIENVSPYALFGDDGGDFNTGATLTAGTYSVTVTGYAGSNGNGQALGSQTISFTLEEAAAAPPANAAPVAFDDSVTLDEDVTTSIDVLANDADEGGPLTIEIVGEPTLGTADVVNNQIVYDPNPNANGPDSLTYRITDSAGLTSGLATVAITIDPVNDAPVLSDITRSIEENSGTFALTLSGEDFGTDPDGSTLYFLDVAGEENGEVTLAGEASILFYSPDQDFAGTETLTVTLWDQQDDTVTGTATLTIVVEPEDAPEPEPTPGPSGLVKAVKIGRAHV